MHKCKYFVLNFVINCANEWKNAFFLRFFACKFASIKKKYYLCAVLYIKGMIDIKKARENAGLTRYRLAKISGVSESTVMRIENGTSIPRLDVYEKLLTALNIDFD